jgi:hypothetical protein
MWSAARIAEGLRDWTFVPSRFNGLMARYHAALEAGTALPVTLADARSRSSSSPRCCMRRRRARASICRSTRRIRSTRAGGPAPETTDRDDQAASMGAPLEMRDTAEDRDELGLDGGFPPWKI